MNDDQWDLKLKTFLKKTGEDLKRAGKDMKAEAERLLTEVKDPEKQKQVRAGLKDLGAWATRTAQDLAVLVESGVKKAETAVRTAVDAPTPTPADTQPPPSAAPAEPLRHDTPVDTPAAGPAKKSIGKKKGSSAKAKTAASRKTIGKK